MVVVRLLICLWLTFKKLDIVVAVCVCVCVCVCVFVCMCNKC